MVQSSDSGEVGPNSLRRIPYTTRHRDTGRHQASHTPPASQNGAVDAVPDPWGRRSDGVYSLSVADWVFPPPDAVLTRSSSGINAQTLECQWRSNE